MAISYREPSLIPPDHEPEPIVERGERVVRRVADGEATWEVRGLLPPESSVLNEMWQDVLEEAYEMGVKAARQQVENIRQNAYGKGVVDAATTAYERGKR
jgi:hypothetical protein